MADFVQQSAVQALAWALVHFVWQGAAIALAAFLAFRVVRTSASLRYAVGVGALAAMLAAPVATFLTLVSEQAPPVAGTISAASDTSLTAPAALPASSAPADSGYATLASQVRVAPEALAVAVFAWIAGVVFFSIRLIGGWMVARRLARRAVQPASEHIQALARHLADRLAVRRGVAILESSFVVVPVMVGWLKPMVVLPMAALSGLSPTQVEALLAHELAHVRRHDYLVNLLQSVAEALLFYHPAVWWLSRRVRAERELCCDDLAVGVCDRLVYVTALTDLAAMASPRVALAATDGDLLGRVRRILGRAQEAPAVRTGVMPGLALVLVAGIAVPVALASATQAPTPAHPHAPVTVAATPPPQPLLTADPSSIDTSGRGPSVHVQGHLGVEQTPPPTAQQIAQQAERQKQIEEARRKLDEAKKVLAQLEANRIGELSVKAIEEYKTALQQAQAAREAELDVARRRFEDARKRFEMGVISETQFQEAQAAFAKVQAKGNAEALLAAELESAKARLDRSSALVERGLLASRDTLDLEASVKKFQQRLAEAQLKLKLEVAPEALLAARAARESGLAGERLQELLAGRLALHAADQEKLAEVVQGLRARIDKGVEGDLKALLEPVPADTPVKAGDVLRITIEGEPDLPGSYRAAEDGTIRLPFVGKIKVVGLTAAQVRDAIGKQLSDRKLGSAAQVTVTLTRGLRLLINRTPESGIIK